MKHDGLVRAEILDELEVIDVLEFAEPRRWYVRRGPRGLVGEPAVGEDRVDDVGLGFDSSPAGIFLWIFVQRPSRPR